MCKIFKDLYRSKEQGLDVSNSYEHVVAPCDVETQKKACINAFTMERYGWECMYQTILDLLIAELGWESYGWSGAPLAPTMSNKIEEEEESLADYSNHCQ